MHKAYWYEKYDIVTSLQSISIGKYEEPHNNRDKFILLMYCKATECPLKK